MKTAQERTTTEPGDIRVSDIESHDCRAVSGILSRIGDKWSVLIISRLGEGSRRFNEIKRMIGGISQRMLTLTLRNLERDGLVKRTVTPTVPPRVDYELTDLGRDLLVPVQALGAWAIEHTPCIEAARARFDVSEAAQTPQQQRVSAG
jgi:DNA-binding HxlR family transcriptional regulator